MALVTENFNTLSNGETITTENTNLDLVSGVFTSSPPWAATSPARGAASASASPGNTAFLSFQPHFQWPTALEWYSTSGDPQAAGFATYADLEGFMAMVGGETYFLSNMIGWLTITATTTWFRFETEVGGASAPDRSVHAIIYQGGGGGPMDPPSQVELGVGLYPFDVLPADPETMPWTQSMLRPWRDGSVVSDEPGVLVTSGAWYASTISSAWDGTAALEVRDADGDTIYSYTYNDTLPLAGGPMVAQASPTGSDFTQHLYVDDFSATYQGVDGEDPGDGDGEEDDGPVDRPVPVRHVGKSWRYIAQRLDGNGGGEFLDWDVPLEDVSIEDVLSGHNALNARISPKVARMVGPDGLPLLDSNWNTAIWAEKDGQIRGGGIITDVSFDGPKLAIEAIGFSGYSMDMPYVGGWYGVKIDPLDVVRHIWEHIQEQPGGNIGLDVDALKSGVKIGVEMEQGEFDAGAGNNPGNVTYYDSSTYKLAWYQDHDLADNIDNLAADTPFDYHERHYWDGETIKHHLDFGYPRMGSKKVNLRFVFGENIFELPSIERSGGTYATEVLALGAGEGRKMKRGDAFRPRKTLGLRRVAVVSDSSLRTQKAINRRAKAELKWRSGLDDISEVVVRDTPHAPLGAVHVGDVIRLEGRASEWREIDMEVRVVSITTEPANGNQAVYTVQRTDAQVGGGLVTKVDPVDEGGAT